MKRYDKAEIMRRAWQIVRKSSVTISEGLRRSWAATKCRPENKERIRIAAAKAGVNELDIFKSWLGWKRCGFSVIHGQHCRFQATLEDPRRGIGRTFRQSFFSATQVMPLAVTA